MDSRHGDGFEHEHASAFDVRAGLPRAAVEQVAESVAALCQGRLLEVGAGTGEIGVYLARTMGADYVALDRSAAMLALFRARAGAAPALLVADASASWPFRTASFDGVWMARVAHLFERARLARELVRVVKPGGLALIGRRQRERDSVRALLRRALHRLLEERGYTPRKGGREAHALCELTPELRFAERRRIASWQVDECAQDALSAWRDKPGISGIDVSDSAKRELLEALHGFAVAQLGADLSIRRSAREHFVIDVLTRAPA
jgi:SAM-dependent methyltransferase